MIFSLKIQNYLIFHFIHNNLSGKSFCLHSGRADEQQHFTIFTLQLNLVLSRETLQIHFGEAFAFCR